MANPRCCVCNKHGATSCSTCKSAFYCSDNCMRYDERTHTLLCASFAAFNETRPTKTAVLALYFPLTTYGEKGLSAPEIVWVDPHHEMHIVERSTSGSLKYTDPLEYNPVEIEVIQPENSSDPVLGRDKYIFQNYAKNFTLMHPVVLYARDAFDSDGSRPNLTLVEIAQEQLRFGWKGPLILYSKDLSKSSECQDVTLSDFRSFLDFCKVYECSAGGLMDSLRTNNFIELEMTNPSLFAAMLLHFSRNRTFQGVEITCEGDRIHLNMDQFISVAVPVAHPIFDDVNDDSGLIADDGATEASKMIELPLLVRRVFPDKRWNKRKGMALMYNNPVAAYLKLDTESQSLEWGFPDSGDQEGEIYGRVLVVREDQLSITARQVEAVCAYFKEVSKVLYSEKQVRLLGLPGDHSCEGRAKLMAEHVSRSKFEQFFNEYKERKVKEGDVSWKDEVSPYEVVAEESDDDDLGSEIIALDLGSDSEREEHE